MAKKKRIKPSEYLERMLKALVKEYDVPGNESIRRNGMPVTTLAIKAGIVEHYENQQLTSNTPGPTIYGDFPSETEANLRIMEERGWVEKLGPPNDVYVRPTDEGLHHGKWLLRPWYLKALDPVRAIRAIYVATVEGITRGLTK